MAEKIINMQKTRKGKTVKATAPESAFKKVWSKRGWTEVKGEKTATTSSTVPTETTPSSGSETK